MLLKWLRKFLYLLVFSMPALIFCYLGWRIINTGLEHSKTSVLSANIVKTKEKIPEFELFSTVTDDGWRRNNFLGHWNLIFFGYSSCPDICPAVLSVLKNVWHRFNKHDQPPKLVFVSLDPKEQSDRLRFFLHNYNDAFVGVFGKAEEVAKLKDHFKVYSEQTSERINHSSALYLINPKGELKAVFTPSYDPMFLYYDLQVLTH